ncbi:alpha-L-rhamnosidase C-terminal domain-containing protein [Parapedobacter sp. 10938]|uniref:alpha-L-rhamnosidase-related protein n=1 Tax=Parapedobacter flavus TaxID=3110225 RepID=UPI002DBD7F2D|nr:alpha-L-rhamnosidase C-terminal domain-containing protein [Parapedobacter sp. 10938]MEC3880487.1 alpha-L-rhamnosidase C-terminal domain-containing protein [Parapedobacter sp. 10938]
MISTGQLAVAGTVKPTGLMTNLLTNPQKSVITTSVPVFSWIVPTLERNDYQTAYQLLVASSPALLEQGRPDLWNSGKTEDGNSLHVAYTGDPLDSHTVYYWQVRTWNKSGTASAYSEIQQFHIGDAGREKRWPGESRWVQLDTGQGEKIWTFEDRAPIQYHPAYPIQVDRKSEGDWFIAFERAGFANVALTLNWKVGPGQRTDTTLQVRIGEKNVGDSIDAKPGGGVIYREYPLSIHAGTDTYYLDIPRFKPHYPHSQTMPEHMMEVIPFRFVEISGGGLDLAVVSAEQLSLHVPFDEDASYFVSSDTLLNDIYDLCRYSVIANTFNGDYAASQRERMMYEADAYIHQLGHYAVDREFATARYSLENMIYHATWPTEWISHSIMMVWMDFLHTGDTSVIRQNYDVLKPKLMTALTMPNGLISTTTGLVTDEFKKAIFFNGETLRDIVDWPQRSSAIPEGGETDGYVFTDYNTVVNAFHYHTLKLMEKMARAVGRNREADELQKTSARFSKLFQRHFFDNRQGVYIDGIGTDHASLHANLYPLAFGLVPEKNKHRVLEYIKTKGMACGVYSANYLLEGLFNAGEGAYAMSLLTSTSDRSWYNMLRVGATMTTEAWDTKYKNNNGWSHAWSASPAHILPRKVMGVTPAAPGFRRVTIKPQPSGLTWAKAKLPTIRGPIETGFDQQANAFSLTVTLPANMKADVYLPIPTEVSNFTLLQNGIMTAAERKGNYLLLQNVGAGRHEFKLNY